MLRPPEISCLRSSRQDEPQPQHFRCQRHGSFLPATLRWSPSLPGRCCRAPRSAGSRRVRVQVYFVCGHRRHPGCIPAARCASRNDDQLGSSSLVRRGTMPKNVRDACLGGPEAPKRPRASLRGCGAFFVRKRIPAERLEALCCRSHSTPAGSARATPTDHGRIARTRAPVAPPGRLVPSAMRSVTTKCRQCRKALRPRR